MKKILKYLAICLLLMAFITPPASAWRPNDYAQASGEKSADGVAVSGAGYLYGIMVTGTTDCAIVVYDNTAASGTKLLSDWAVANGTEELFSPPDPIAFDNGVYVDETGTCTWVVYYRKQ